MPVQEIINTRLEGEVVQPDHETINVCLDQIADMTLQDMVYTFGSFIKECNLLKNIEMDESHLQDEVLGSALCICVYKNRVEDVKLLVAAGARGDYILPQYIYIRLYG
jgi:hypothetical protein